METITILAEALCKALTKQNGWMHNWCVLRLDIQYNTKSELYTGRAWFAPDPDADPQIIRDINEDGTIQIVPITEVL